MWIKDILKNYKFNTVIKVLIFCDVIAWAIASLLPILFPIYVIRKIDDGTLITAGLGIMIFYIAQALMNLVSGYLMDKKRGLKDEYYSFFWAILFRAIGVLAFIWVSSNFEYYILQVLNGLAQGIASAAWRVVFSNFTDRRKQATEWSTDLALVNLAIGIFAFTGTYLADQIDLFLPFKLGAALLVLAAICTLIIRPHVKHRFPK